MRGVTVRMMPASLYSTVWVPTIEFVPVDGVAPIGTCWDVRIGTDRDTLMTAFLFSAVMIDGLESTLTLFWVDNALRAIRNSWAANVKKLNPDAALSSVLKGGTRSAGLVGNTEPPGAVLKLAVKRPFWIAHCRPRRVLSSSVTSAASTSMSTWRGIRSSFLMIASISDQARGYVVTMIEFVVSSGMNRVSPRTPSASRKLGARPGVVPKPPVVRGKVGE